MAADIRGLAGLGNTLPAPAGAEKSPGPGFGDLLKERAKAGVKEIETPKLQFSNHAVERMRSRGIMLEPNDVERIQQAVDKAHTKGSRETLVLMGDSAFIVNVKNKTVVTAMDREMMKENVFTNIDSTVVI
ncbi:MAG: TIGR02530 family flagellar biosynthesis protein [Bdellovibrionia bacterium]